MARPSDLEWGWVHGKVCRLRTDVVFPDDRGKVYSKGDLVKVVMVSRFGDVGITRNLHATSGYDARVRPEALEPTDGTTGPMPPPFCLSHGEYVGDPMECPDCVAGVPANLNR